VHLGRDAYVYVRQSTVAQVREHGERAWPACPYMLVSAAR
jgi:hypothetical protein